MPAQKSDENAAIGPVGPIGSAKSNGLVRDRPLCRPIRKHCRCSRLTGSIAVVPYLLSVIFKGGSRSTAGTTGMRRKRPFRSSRDLAEKARPLQTFAPDFFAI